ncbi:hypothetical protein HanIR_Chr10g0481451 [Helianthus annuus]|nr:hypothetical protein HanIR_Chr10g0481451 [Helianthus annuus]
MINIWLLNLVILYSDLAVQKVVLLSYSIHFIGDWLFNEYDPMFMCNWLSESVSRIGQVSCLEYFLMLFLYYRKLAYLSVDAC